jgi:hypothetical protein
MGHVSETQPFAKRQPVFRFHLDFGQGVPREQVVRNQLFAPVRGEGEITGAVSEIEGTADQLAFAGRIPYPRDDGTAEGNIGPRLVTRQAALFDQVEPELAKAVATPVIAELRAGRHRKPRVAKARCIAISMRQAEVHHAAYDERKQVFIVEQGRCHDLGEDVHRVDDIAVVRQGQIDKCFDRPRSQRSPDAFIFAQRILACRTIRPRCSLPA